MPELATVAATIPSSAWWAFAGGMTVVLALNAWPLLRRTWHEWRFKRLLARNSHIMSTELREYEQAIGDEYEPLGPDKWIVAPVAAGVLVALPFWFEATGHSDWWMWATIAYGGCGIALAVWRWLNDPESGPLELPTGTVPTEAVQGFVAAIALVGAVIAAIVLFV